MKVLFVCQYFFPEVFRGNDIAFYWAEKGYDVQVVCGIPNYPEGSFYKGFGWFKRRHEVVMGVRVTRLPIIPRGKNKVMLLLNYFSYMVVASVWVLFHSIRHRYDRVFVQQLSPVMMSAPGVIYKKLRHAPLYTWVLDLWPESLTAAGGISNKFVLGFFRHFVKSEYLNSDKILISSRSFEESVLEYGDYKDKIVYFPQWSDAINYIEADYDGTETIRAVKSSGCLKGGFIVMFAGAVGEAHGFECIMEAARLTKDHKEIKWVIIGDGRKLEWVCEYVKKNQMEETVLTLGHFPPETMPWFFSKADVMLVSLRDSPLFRLYAPAKISSYMANSKPIIAVLNGEGADVINNASCGWTIPAGDYDGLAKLVINLSKIDKTVLVEKGNNAAKYYNDNFVKEKCLARLDIIMDI